jgi:hypothetical protein
MLCIPGFATQLLRIDPPAHLQKLALSAFQGTLPTALEHFPGEGSYHAMSYVDDNLLPGEEVIYEAELHWSIFLSPLAWLLIGIAIAAYALTNKDSPLSGYTCYGSIMLLLMAAAGAVAAELVTSTTEFALTDRRIIAKHGVIQRRSLEIQLAKVESLRVVQPLLGMILNYGTVYVVGTGGTHEVFKNIAKPQELRKQVQARLQAPR